MQLAISRREIKSDSEFELVERKGRGHPDTLSDRLAEYLSTKYSNYTKERFDVVLHHNFDKVGILGGQSRATFGEGVMLKPMRVLLNGRAAEAFGTTPIPIGDLLREWASGFLKRELPLIDVGRDLSFQYNVSSANTPGYPSTDFRPGSSNHLRQTREMRSSDTAAVCMHAPVTPLESTVLAVENLLTSDEYRGSRHWLGSDVKVLASRVADRVGITVCVPQIAGFVFSAEEYKRNLNEVRRDINHVLDTRLHSYQVDLHLNTKDDFENGELYLTVLGTCAESGDEGLVGRGNRPNGLISANRPYTGEAACGKHPVFFPGKVYPVVARDIADQLVTMCGSPVEVWLVAQEGRPLSDPWRVAVVHDGGSLAEAKVLRVVQEALGKLPAVTDAILAGRAVVC